MASTKNEAPLVICALDTVVMTTIIEEDEETAMSSNIPLVQGGDEVESHVSNDTLGDDGGLVNHNLSRTLGTGDNESSSLYQDASVSSCVLPDPMHAYEATIVTTPRPSARQLRPLTTASVASSSGDGSREFYDEHILTDDSAEHRSTVARHRHLVVGVVVLTTISSMCALVVALVMHSNAENSAPSAQQETISLGEESQLEQEHYEATFDSENELFLFLRDFFQVHSSHPFSFLSPDSVQSRALAWFVAEEQQDPTLHIWNQAEMLLPRLLQRYALIVLFLSCGGNTWIGIKPWISQNLEHECDWDQVTCNDKEQVIGISAHGIDMIGSLPEELGILSHLQFFDASQNRLQGSLPSSLTGMTDLKSLGVSLNNMAFSIPTEIGLLTNLESLEMAFNTITGDLPQELKQLTNLQLLDVFHNANLKGPIFDFVSHWPNLQHLIAGFTGLVGPFPEDTNHSLYDITTLDVRGLSNIYNLPTTIGVMTNLEVLYSGRIVHDDPTSAAPPVVGTIPTEIGLATNLKYITLDESKLTGAIPSEMGLLSNMASLFLNHNKLTGVVPSELGNLEGITRLVLSENELTGSLPTELGSLSNLRWLHVEGNTPGLVIPTEVCSNRGVQISYGCLQVCECCTMECFTY